MVRRDGRVVAVQVAVVACEAAMRPLTPAAVRRDEKVVSSEAFTKEGLPQ